MLSSFLFMLALATGTRIDVHGDVGSPIRIELPSCGAAERLSRERFVITVLDQDRARVNYTDWRIVETLSDGSIHLRYSAKPDAFTYMEMLVIPIDGGRLGHTGIVALFGRLPDRRECADAVRLIGS